jgi:hypothetical protein
MNVVLFFAVGFWISINFGFVLLRLFVTREPCEPSNARSAESASPKIRLICRNDAIRNVH